MMAIAFRWRWIWLAPLVLVAMTAAGHAAQVTKRALTYDGRSRSFYAYVPGALPEKPIPIIVLLHGSGRDGHTIIQLWKPMAQREGLALVAPNAHTMAGWVVNDDGPGFLRAAIEAVAATTPVDARRIYLFGQSGGAVHALIVSMLEAQYFAATAVHAGAWRLPREFIAMRFARRKIPLQIIIGSRDEFFPMAAVHKTQQVLRQAGFPIAVKIMYGERHWYTSDTAPAINEIAWNFLKAHRLDTAPVFTRYK
jgi:poly(3-hydroxybutyrate) depolymerase